MCIFDVTTNCWRLSAKISKKAKQFNVLIIDTVDHNDVVYFNGSSLQSVQQHKCFTAVRRQDTSFLFNERYINRRGLEHASRTFDMDVTYTRTCRMLKLPVHLEHNYVVYKTMPELRYFRQP